MASPEEYSKRPPLLASSFPKSGTHLLAQIVGAFPETIAYGTVWASRPSISRRERPERQLVRMIGRAVPGELVTGHLFHSTRVAGALRSRRILHFFIYRDLRDVAVSEAHYLTHMNRWHRLHPLFKELPDEPARIRLAITGNRAEGGSYDDIGTRFGRYRGWLADQDTYAVRFERLVGVTQEETVREMASYVLGRGVEGDIDLITAAALRSIEPSRSHTFRRGRSGGWVDHFTEEHSALMKKVAGDLLVDLGYESRRDW